MLEKFDISTAVHPGAPCLIEDSFSNETEKSLKATNTHYPDIVYLSFCNEFETLPQMKRYIISDKNHLKSRAKEPKLEFKTVNSTASRGLNFEDEKREAKVLITKHDN